MKKLSIKQWKRDVKNGILHRQGQTKWQRKPRKKASNRNPRGNDHVSQWIDTKKATGELDITITKKRHLTINLPEKMNFNADYETTALHMSAIRKLSITEAKPRKRYGLKTVNFDNLKEISTSAALVLTAELSKWNDAIRQSLTPDVSNWSPDILKKLKDLGFFNLFAKSPTGLRQSQEPEESSVNLVKYIKGKSGDNNKARILKEQVLAVVDDEIDKWTNLHAGLTEAITNVSHHAYPANSYFSENNKNWYMSGSYNRDTKELKVVFYDQGIGIPKSLPASKVWEKVLSWLSNIPIAERKKDEVLLKAAVQISRTSTGAADRGKGLQDLTEFIRQREEGYLSILSLRGLYKLTVKGGNEKTKSVYFNNKINGTLIIWSVTLHDQQEKP